MMQQKMRSTFYGIASSRIIPLLATLLLAVAACNSEDTEIRDLRALEKEVMDIHDEVMPKMTDISQMRVKLKKYAEDNDPANEMRTEIDNAIQGLERADEAMWDWMHEYQRPDYEGDLDEARKYLETEKASIEQVSSVMMSNIARADSLINALGIQ